MRSGARAHDNSLRRAPAPGRRSTRGQGTPPARRSFAAGHLTGTEHAARMMPTINPLLPSLRRRTTVETGLWKLVRDHFLQKKRLCWDGRVVSGDPPEEPHGEALAAAGSTTGSSHRNCHREARASGVGRNAGSRACRAPRGKVIGTRDKPRRSGRERIAPGSLIELGRCCCRKVVANATYPRAGGK